MNAIDCSIAHAATAPTSSIALEGGYPSFSLQSGSHRFSMGSVGILCKEILGDSRVGVETGESCESEISYWGIDSTLNKRVLV